MRTYQFNDELLDESQRPLACQLLERENFDQSDRLLGSATGRGITYFLHTPEFGVDCVRRHYYRGGLFGKWVKDRYLFLGETQSRAVAEFRLLKQLHQLGLPVPRPIACQTVRHGLCYQADILLEKIAHTQDLSRYLQQQRLAPAQYAAIGALIARLHQHQVHHSDLNIHNILIDSQGKFWLIDFDKCRIQTGSRWKNDNLNRLKRSFLKEQQRLGILFHDSDWQALMQGYLGK